MRPPVLMLLLALLAAVLAVACTAQPVTVSPTPAATVATATPPAAAATATPTATAAATAAASAALLKSNFGLIYGSAGAGWEPGLAPSITPEGSTTKVGELAGSYFNQFHGAVSPDGRRAIYAAQPERLGAWAYYLLDGRKPTEQRRLLALPDEIPGMVLWSADMSAIAFTAQDSGSWQGVIPKYDSIRTLDLATGVVRELARITDGSYYRIVGWDKSAGTLAAQINPHANDGTNRRATYLVIGPSGMRTTPIDGGPSAFAASHDGRTVAGLQCATATGCSLWLWPLGDYNARADQRLPAGMLLNPIGFRPGTSDVGFTAFELNHSSGRIVLWSASAGLRTVYPFPPGRIPGGPAFFRADGSAMIVDFGAREEAVIDVGTGQSTRLPPSQTSSRGSVASIRLD